MNIFLCYPCRYQLKYIDLALYGPALQRVQYSLESEREQHDTLPNIPGSGLVPMHLTLLWWRPLAFGALGPSSRWTAPLEGDLVLQRFHSQATDLALKHPLKENLLLPLLKPLIKLYAPDLKCACLVFKIPTHHFPHGKKGWVEFTPLSPYEEYWRKERTKPPIGRKCQSKLS